MRVATNFMIIFIFLINTLEIDGVFKPVTQQSSPAPVTEAQLAWNTRVLNAILPTLSYLNESGEVYVSETCKKHYRLYKDAFKNLKTWALQMFDASTKIPEGILSGSITHLGNFDQCLAVKAYDDDDQHVFNGHYCGTYIYLSSDARSVLLQIASCFPSTCTPQEISATLLSELGPALSMIGMTLGVGVKPIDCYIEGDKPALGCASWVVISIFILLAFVVFVGTLCDFLQIKTGSEIVDSVYQSFSLTRNLKSLMKSEHAPGNIQCMNGLRVGSIFWVILSHRYYFQITLPKINSLEVLERFDDFKSQILLNGMLAVDTFFFMGGFLVCYLLMKDLNKGNKFNPIMYYVYRYLRLTTSYALVIAFYSTLYGDIGYGPKWRTSVNTVTEICKDTWWISLLYVNNLVQIDKYANLGQAASCLSQGWYLACDMQFALVAPLVLLPLYYWPKWTTKALIILILVSCLAPYTLTYVNEFYMTSYFFDPKFIESYNRLYMVSYMRATPYLMGIGLAYIMFKKPDCFHMPKWLVSCGWITSTAVAIVVIFIPTVMYQPGYQYEVVSSAFYSGFHGLAWSAVIGWIILACHYGYGGVINSILSWSGWLPLSRLTYCMFLVHFYIMSIDAMQVRALTYIDHFSNLQRFCGDIIFSTIIGAVLHLLIEAPTLGVLKTFFKGPAEKSEPAMKCP